MVGKDAFASAEKIFGAKKIKERSLKVMLKTNNQRKDDKRLKEFHVLFVSAGEAL